MFFGLCRFFRGILCPFGQHFESRGAVEAGVVFPGHWALRHQGSAGGRIKGAKLRGRRADQGPLDNTGYPLFLQHRRDGFAHADLADRFFGLETRIVAVGLGGETQVFAVSGGKGAQGMLDTVAQLAKDIFGYIGGVLRDEIHPHPFGADQTRHLFHLIYQRFGGVIKQQMCFVKKENKFGFLRIADLGQFLEKFGQQPQQKGRIKFWGLHQLVSGEDVDKAAPVRVGPHQIA